MEPNISPLAIISLLTNFILTVILINVNGIVSKKFEHFRSPSQEHRTSFKELNLVAQFLLILGMGSVMTLLLLLALGIVLNLGLLLGLESLLGVEPLLKQEVVLKLKVLFNERGLVSGLFLSFGLIFWGGRKYREEVAKLMRIDLNLGVLMAKILIEKTSTALNAVLTLLLIQFLLILSTALFGERISNFINILISSLPVLITLELWIFNFRIEKGWYGKNKFEALEIAKFISKLSKNDFDDFDGEKENLKDEREQTKKSSSVTIGARI